MILLRTFISSFLIFVLFTVSVNTLAAGKRKEYCDVDPDFRQLILEMYENPKLATSLRKDPNLAKTWLELEQIPNFNDEDGKPLNTDPAILREFIKVPSVKTGKFKEWFDDLTVQQVNELWQNTKIAEDIKDRLRDPGNKHEWCMVCRAPTFKEWGVTVQEIWDFRTDIDKISWDVPEKWVTDKTTAGPGTHGGNGSERFHLLLAAIIDDSSNLAEFNTKLQVLMSEWNVKPPLPPLR